MRTIAWLACALTLGAGLLTILLSNDAPAVPAATRDMQDQDRARGSIAVAPPADSQTRRTATPAERASIANPVSAMPLADLTGTRERPIFSPSRRPPPPAVAPPAAEPAVAVAPRPVKPKRPQLSLVGTIVSDTAGIGLFVEPQTKNVIRLKTGEGYDGWTLRSVEGREATLATDSAATILALPAPGTDQPAEPRSVAPRSAEQRPVEKTDPPPADADPPPPRKREPRPKRVHH